MYKVQGDQQGLRLVAKHAHPVAWWRYSHPARMLLLGTGDLGSWLQVHVQAQHRRWAVQAHCADVVGHMRRGSAAGPARCTWGAMLHVSTRSLACTSTCCRPGFLPMPHNR